MTVIMIMTVIRNEKTILFDRITNKNKFMVNNSSFNQVLIQTITLLINNYYCRTKIAMVSLRKTE